MVCLAMEGANDHFVLVVPDALHSSLSDPEAYVPHSVRLSRVRDRLVATRTKVPVTFVETPAATVGDYEAFEDYQGEEFVPFCQRFLKALPLGSDVLFAYRGIPIDGANVEEAPEAAGVVAAAPADEELADLLRVLTSQVGENFGAIQRRFEAP